MTAPDSTKRSANLDQIASSLSLLQEQGGGRSPQQERRRSGCTRSTIGSKLRDRATSWPVAGASRSDP